MPILQPQATGMIGTSPRDTAYQTMQQRNATLADLGKIGGKKYRRRRIYGGRIYGGQAMVTVPPVPGTNLINDPAKNTSQGVASQQVGMAKLTLNNDAQKALDSKVTLAPIPKGSTGGSKRTKRRGGFVWPCLSGGRKSKKLLKRKSKKSSKKSSRKSSRRH